MGELFQCNDSNKLSFSYDGDLLTLHTTVRTTRTRQRATVCVPHVEITVPVNTL